MRITKEIIIISTIGIVFLIGFGFLIYFFNSSVNSPTISINSDLLIKETSHMTGTLGSKVTLVEFGDYQCPACGQMFPLTEEIIKTYGQNPNFNFVYRHFPLPQHKNSIIAAEVAEAAAAQGKFWEMHKLIYMNQDEWSEESEPLLIFKGYAEKLGLNVSKFINDLNQNIYKEIIQSDSSDGMRIPLDHTPTLFINGIEEQNINLSNLKRKIDVLLQS